MSNSNAPNRSVNRINVHPGSAQQSPSVGWTSAGGSMNHPLSIQYSTTGDHSSMEDRPAGAEGGGTGTGGTGTGAASEHQEQGCNIPVQDDPCKITIIAPGSDGLQYEDTVPDIGLSVWFHLKHCENEIDLGAKLRSANIFTKVISHDQIELWSYGNSNPPITNDIFMKNCKTVCEIIKETTDKYCRMNIQGDDKLKEFIVKKWQHTHLFQSKMATAHRAHSGCLIVVAGWEHRNDVHLEIRKLLSEYHGEKPQGILADGSTVTEQQPRCYGKWPPIQDFLKEDGDTINVLLQTHVALTEYQLLFLKDKPEAQKCVTKYFKEKEIECMYNFDDMELALTADKKLDSLPVKVLEEVVRSFTVQLDMGKDAIDGNLLHLIEERFSHCKEFFMMIQKPSDHLLSVIATRPVLKDIQDVMQNVAVKAEKKRIELMEEDYSFLLEQKKWIEYEPVLVDGNGSVVLIRTVRDTKGCGLIVQGTSKNVDQFERGVMQVSSVQLTALSHELMLIQRCPEVVKYIEETLGCHLEVRGDNVWISSSTGELKRAEKTFHDLIVSDIIRQQNESVFDLLTLEELKEMLMENNGVHHDKLLIEVDKTKLTLTGTTDIFPDVIKDLENIKLKYSRTEDFVPMSEDHIEHIHPELLLMLDDSRLKVSAISSEKGYKLTGSKLGVAKVKEWLLHTCTVREKKGRCQVIALGGLTQRLLKESSTARQVILDACEQHGFELQLDDDNKSATITVQKPEDLLEASHFFSSYVVTFSVNEKELGHITPFELRSLLLEKNPELTAKVLLHANDEKREIKLIGPKDFALPLFEQLKQILNDYAHDEICLHLENQEIHSVHEKVFHMKSKVSAEKVELCCTSERVEMKGARVHVQSCWETFCEYLTELKQSRKIDLPPKLRMCEQNVSSLIHVALDQNNNIKSYIAMCFDEHGYYFEVSEGRLRLFAGSITALHAVREMFLSLIVEKIFSLSDEPVVRIHGLKYVGSKLADEPSYEGKMMTHVDDDKCQVRVVCTDDIQDQVEDHFLQIVKMYQEETVDIQVSEHITENLQQLEDDLFLQSPDTKGRFRIFVKFGKICVVADRDCMAMVKTKIEQMVMWKERELVLKRNVPHKDLKLSDIQFEFIQKPVVINYIDNTLKIFQYEIIMVGKMLRIYALKNELLDKVIRDVLNCLTEENIDMSTDPLPLYHIKGMLDAQVALHGGKLLTEVDQEKKCLKMICTRDVRESVLSKLEGIRAECSDVTHTVALSSAKWQQIRLIYPEELHELGKEVKLEFSYEGIHVTGHHKVVGKGITNLKNIIKKVHVKTFPITDDKCILQAYEGQDLISNIQKSEQCMITVQEHERETTDGMVGKEYLAELHLKLSSSVILFQWTSKHGSSISIVQGSIQNISSENLAVPVVGGELPAEICHILKNDQSLKRKIYQLKNSKQFSITNPSWCKCHSVVFFGVPLSLKDSKNQERESLRKTIKEIIKQTELNKSATCAFFLEALCKKELQSVGIKSIIRGTQEALKELTHTIDVQLLADENRSSEVIEILKAACPESSKISLWKQFKKLRRKKNLEKVSGKSSDIDRPPAIKIVSGKLEDQKVDVLVNSVNKELELSKGNVSKALDDATGGLLQKECKRQFSNGIVPGQVAVTSFPGKGTAEQKVYHGVLYCFPRGEQNEPTEEECWKMMCEFIYRCLYEANKEGKESIAFPVLGSGKLRYPPLQVAEVMFDTVEWFFSVHQTSLKMVHFVVYGADREINKLFTAEWMARNYDIRNIMKGSKARETRHDCGNIMLQIIESDLQMCKGISDGLLCFWKKHQLTDPSKHPIVGKHLESMQWALYGPVLSNTNLTKTKGDGLPANIIFHTLVNTDFRTALYNGLNCAVEMNCRTVQFGLLSQDIPVDIKQFVTDLLKVLKQGKIASRDLCLVTVVVPNQDCYSSVVAQLNASHSNYWGFFQDAISFIPGTSARKTESSSPEYASGRPGDETQLVVAGKSEKHCNTVCTHVNDRIGQIQHHSKNSPETYRSDGSSVDGMAPNPLFQDCDERETDDKVFGLCRVKLKPVVTEDKNWSSMKSNLEHIGLELQSYGQHVYAEGSFEALSKAHEQLSIPADKPVASGFEKDVQQTGLTSIVSNVHFEAVFYFIGKTEFEQFCDIEEISDSKKKILFTASQEHKEKVLSLHQRIQGVIQEEVDLSKLDQIQVSNQKAYEVEKSAMSDNRDVYIKYADNRHVMILFAEDWDKMSRAKKRMMLQLGQGKVASRGKRRFANQSDSTLKTDIKQHGNISFVMESGAAVAEGRSFTVKVYKESIVSLALDVIVNAANGRLSHGGGVARIIASAAGRQLEDEGNSIVRQRGDIPVTDLAVTNSGNLPCKRVFHAVGPKWSDYTDKERCLEDLYCTILRCLCEAVNRSFETIAFPSICSSIFGVPKEECAKMYVRALKSFDTLVERGSLKEVHFVDISDTMVTIIQTELQNTWSQPGKKENLTKDRAFIMKCLDSNTSASVTTLEVTPGEHKEKDNNAGTHWLGKSGSVSLRVVKDDILKIDADAILSWVDTGFSTTSPLHRLLKNTGGESYERARDKAYRMHKSWGDIAEGPGGSLQQKRVIFAITHTTPTKEDILPCLIKALDWCVKNKLTNLVLPKLPSSKSAHGNLDITFIETTVDQLIKLDQDERKPTLHVQIVDYQQHVVDGLMHKLQQYLVTCGLAAITSKETEVQGGEDCVICLSPMTDPVKLKCGHQFCKQCVDRSFKIKAVCPVCKMKCGMITGNMPPGTMRDTVDYYTQLPGYIGCGTIVITYDFHGDRQTEEHPDPGQWYRGFTRTAYLPNNAEGRKVLSLLGVAWKRRLTFTIGRSVTMGRDSCITWNEIHHKTNTTGGPTNHGYPDLDYLRRVQEELADQGVTEEDLGATGTSV